MRVRSYHTALAWAVGMGLVSSATVQAQKSTLVVMPAQYFSADAQSAHRVANELAYQYGRRGYTVISMDRSRANFVAMHLKPNRSYSDAVASQFGRRIGADLVVYPQLLAAGLNYGSPTLVQDAARSGAVLHLRVVNARTGRRLYSRQVRQSFQPGPRGGVLVPPMMASALASKSSNLYFERVAGSRQEIRGAP